MKCSLMMVFTASLLHTSLLRHWQAKSWTFWMLIMSHLFSCCPQSFAYKRGQEVLRPTHPPPHDIKPRRAHELKGRQASVSPEGVLTVSKLPLCMSSMGGRKRSARVLSFLSTVPLRSSCSWRTATTTFPWSEDGRLHGRRRLDGLLA